MEQAKVDAEKRRAEKLAERERKKAEAERVALGKKRDENLTDTVLGHGPGPPLAAMRDVQCVQMGIAVSAHSQARVCMAAMRVCARYSGRRKLFLRLL